MAQKQVGSASIAIQKLYDGKSQYIFVRYSKNSNGDPMVDKPTAETKYMGIYTSDKNTASTKYGDYSWTQIKGSAGDHAVSGVLTDEFIAINTNSEGNNGDFSRATTGILLFEGLLENTKDWTIQVTTTSGVTGTYDTATASYKVTGMTVDSGTITFTAKKGTATVTKKATVQKVKAGADGSDGIGIKSTKITYQISSSGTDIPTDTWVETLPSAKKGEFLWTRTTITYTDNKTSESYTVAFSGRDGSNGSDGTGIETTVINYQASTNGVTAPTGTWLTTIPTVAAGSYLWTRTVITYTDNNTSTAYSVSRAGTNGSNGTNAKLLYLSSDTDVVQFDKNDVQVTKSVTFTANLQNITGDATFVAIPYKGETAQSATTLTGTGNIKTLSSWDKSWTKVIVTATLESLKDTQTVIKIKEAKDGTDGTDGVAGKDGIGLSKTTIHYAVSSSSTTPPAEGWTENAPTLVKGQYLWTRTIWTYTDNSTETGYSVSYIAKDGNDGTDGLAGKDGVGITSTKITYVGSISGTTKPTSGWTDTIPTVAAGSYLWTRTVWTYTDNTSETGYSVAKMGNTGATGAKGADGVAGKDGVGISNTTITYAMNNSGTVAPTNGWTDTVPTLIKGQYLWTKTVWTYTDSTKEEGYSVAYISKDGNNGTDGIAGKDGVGIASTTITYVGSTSGTTTPTSGWTTTIPNVAAGSYLWTKTVWTYTDSTSETGYSVAKMGTNGTNGKDGLAGKDGVGIKTTDIKYALSTSGTVAPSSGWTTNVPPLTKGQYLWTQTVWVYTDDSLETGYSVSYVSKDGNNGKDGLAGKDGVGISDTTITYAKNTSGMEPPTSGWTETAPEMAKGQYLWTRTIWTYTDGTNETGYSSAYWGTDGVNGTNGKDGVAGKDGVGISDTVIKYALSTSGATAPSSGWTTTVPTLVKGQYLWTQTTWTYTDKTSETGYSVSYVSKDGNNGTDGIAGKDGVGIKSTVINYVQSTSGTTTPTTGWTASVPTLIKGQYLWTRSVWTYTDDSTETGYSIAYNGVDGNKGDKGDSNVIGFLTNESITLQAASNGNVSDFNKAKGTFKVFDGLKEITSGVTFSKVTETGSTSSINSSGAYTITAMSADTATIDLKAVYNGVTITKTVSLSKSRAGSDGSNGSDGIGVKKTEVSYQGSTSGTTTPTGSWSTTIPEVANGSYLWTRTVITYSDNSNTTSYSISRIGIDGVDGGKGADGVGVKSTAVTYQSSTGGTIAPTGTWATTIPTVVAGSYLWTRTIITYTDNSSSTAYSVSKAGTNGTNGSSAKLLYLSSDTDVIQFDSSNNQVTPSLTITANLQNVTGNATFTATPYILDTAQAAITLDGTGNVRSLTSWNKDWTRLVVVAKLDTLTDTKTIVKIKESKDGVDGADGKDGESSITGFLTNESTTLGASTSGAVSDFSSAKGIFKVYDGLVEKTGSGVVYSKVSETGATGAINASTGVYSVTAMSADSATVEFKAVYKNVTINKTFSLSKSKTGTSGTDGKDGSNGNGIKSTEVSYQVSTSGSTTPTGTWVTTIPTIPAGQFLWTRTILKYTDNTSTTSYSISRAGTDGSNGSDGLGIKSTSITYQAGTSGTTAPTGTWSTAIPSVSASQYLWTKTETTYTDNSKTNAYSVGKMGDTGAPGASAQLLFLTSDSNVMKFNADGTSSAQTITFVANLQNVTGTSTFTATPYIGTSAQSVVTLGGTGNTRTLTNTQWNSNWTSVVVEAKLNSLTDKQTIVKLQEAKDGTNGKDGSNGSDGKGIKNTTITYQASSSGTTIPTGSWLTTIPSVSANQFLWTKTTITYTDNTSTDGYSVGKMGSNGTNGTNGSDGKDGNGISKTEITYQAGASGTDKPTGSWSTTVPNVSANQYLWTKTTFTFTNGSTADAYSVGKMGANGSNGTDGTNGKDGVGITKTEVTYQSSTSGTVTPTGTWSTTIPSVAANQFLWTKTTISYSDNTKTDAYSVGKMGATGSTGAAGNGISKTEVTYQAASDGVTVPTGTWSTAIPNVAANQYLWTRTVLTFTNSTTSTSYSIGKMGANGTNGKDGVDGKTQYTHIAYANSADGKTDFSTTDSNREYIGMYVDFKEADSSIYTDYNWTKVKGVDGTEGAPGKPGTDGKTPYFHTAWATSADGKIGFSTTDSANKTYLGSYTDYTSADSTDPTKYKWSLIKGSDGRDGADGSNGIGISKTDITYQASSSGTTVPTGTWATTIPSVAANQYLWTKTTLTYTDGKTANAYSVGKMGANGTNGTDGRDGTNGNDGIGIKSTAISYQASSSGITIPTGSWVTAPPTVAANQYLWTKTLFTYTNNSTAVAYSIGKIGANGTDGKNGTNGKDGTNGENAVVGLLTNESITLQANSSGTVSDFSKGTGTFKVYDGITDVTASSSTTFALKVGTGGTFNINASTGAYAITAMSTDTAEATFTATYKGVVIEKTLSVAKSKAGASGANATSYWLVLSSQVLSLPRGATILVPSNFTVTPMRQVGTGTAAAFSARITIDETTDGNTWTNKYSGDSAGYTYTPSSNKVQSIRVQLKLNSTATAILDQKSVNIVRDGSDGSNGKDGGSSYTWIRYSVNSDGNPMTTVPNADSKYIGIAITSSNSAPSAYSDYTWARIKGDGGLKTRLYTNSGANVNQSPITIYSESQSDGDIVEPDSINWYVAKESSQNWEFLGNNLSSNRLLNSKDPSAWSISTQNSGQLKGEVTTIDSIPVFKTTKLAASSGWQLIKTPIANLLEKYFIQGDTYTLMARFYSSKACRISFSIMDGSGVNKNLGFGYVDLEPGWNSIIKEAKAAGVEAKGNHLYVGSVDKIPLNEYIGVEWVTLKKGFHTDFSWSPAPEDFSNSLFYGSPNLLSGTETEKSARFEAATYTTFDPYKIESNKTLADLGFKVGDKVAFQYEWDISKKDDKPIVYGSFLSEAIGADGNFVDNFAAERYNFSEEKTKGFVKVVLTLTANRLKMTGLRFRIDGSTLTFSVSKVRLEKGEDFNPWAPSMEDNYGIFIQQDKSIYVSSSYFLNENSISFRTDVKYNSKVASDQMTVTNKGFDAMRPLILRQPVAPFDPYPGLLWMDTSSTDNYIYRWGRTPREVVDGVKYTHYAYANQLDPEIADFSVYYPNKNLWVETGSKAGFIQTDGSVVNSANLFQRVQETYIPVSSNRTTTIIQIFNPNKTVNTTAIARLAFYTDAKSMIQVKDYTLRSGKEKDVLSYPIPSNAKYIRANIINGAATGDIDPDIKWKIEFSNGESTIYLPAPEDDKDNAYVNFVGTYVDKTEADSTTPTDYHWTTINDRENYTDDSGNKGVSSDNIVTVYDWGWILLTQEEKEGIPWLNNEDGSTIIDWIYQITQNTSDSAIVNKVIGSEQMKDVYASSDELNELVGSNDELASKLEEYNKIMQNYAAQVNSMYENMTEMKQTMDKFLFNIESAGGVNILRNSTGFQFDDDTKQFNYWQPYPDMDGTSRQEMGNQTLNDLGFVAGFRIEGRNQILSQQVTLPIANLEYTLAGFFSKITTIAGINTFAIDVRDAMTNKIIASASSREDVENVTKFSVTFNPSVTEVRVELRLQGDSSTPQSRASVLVAGVMLNIGPFPLSWQSHHEEVYSTNVRIDGSGLKVFNNDYAGYNVITPREFAGYYKDETDGDYEKVFTLNQDTTEVKKLKAEERFMMKPIQIVSIESEITPGWAFVGYTPEGEQQIPKWSPNMLYNTTFPQLDDAGVYWPRMKAQVDKPWTFGIISRPAEGVLRVTSQQDNNIELFYRIGNPNTLNSLPAVPSMQPDKAYTFSANIRGDLFDNPQHFMKLTMFYTTTTKTGWNEIDSSIYGTSYSFVPDKVIFNKYSFTFIMPTLASGESYTKILVGFKLGTNDKSAANLIKTGEYFEFKDAKLELGSYAT